MLSAAAVEAPATPASFELPATTTLSSIKVRVRFEIGHAIGAEVGGAQPSSSTRSLNSSSSVPLSPRSNQLHAEQSHLVPTLKVAELPRLSALPVPAASDPSLIDLRLLES